MGIALVGFGANLGEAEQTYLEVISRLHAFPGIGVICAGRLFLTNPVGGPANQPRYHNGAILCEVDLPPLEVFAVLSQMELSLGRVRGEHWGPRSIDLDLLLSEDDNQRAVCISSEKLTLPHPRLHFRRFALAPANEVGGELLFHPVFGFTIAQLLSHLDRLPRIVSIASANVAQAREFAAEVAQLSSSAFMEASDLAIGATPDEYVAIYEPIRNAATPAQLIIWLSESSEPKYPETILAQWKATKFSTWLSLDSTNWRASIASAAAAVAAMRPFASE
jgi:2-amino-4-hydroxy-6-hydroxymethyldihydropteridine diphosphokinase